jgi:hypothetical protein
MVHGRAKRDGEISPVAAIVVDKPASLFSLALWVT